VFFLAHSWQIKTRTFCVIASKLRKKRYKNTTDRRDRRGTVCVFAQKSSRRNCCPSPLEVADAQVMRFACPQFARRPAQKELFFVPRPTFFASRSSNLAEGRYPSSNCSTLKAIFATPFHRNASTWCFPAAIEGGRRHRAGPKTRSAL